MASATDPLTDPVTGHCAPEHATGPVTDTARRNAHPGLWVTGHATGSVGDGLRKAGGAARASRVHHGPMDSRPALDTDPRVIGERVRQLRQARGVSLSELARRAGIGKATLSGVETGTRNPTLETLWAITAQLGVPISAILDSPPNPRLVRGTAAEAAMVELFEDRDVTYELFRLRIPPGITQRSPAHLPGATEHITVFIGTLTAGPVDAPLTAGPGEHMAWRADVPHLYHATGTEVVHASLLMRYPAAALPASAAPSQ